MDLELTLAAGAPRFPHAVTAHTADAPLRPAATAVSPRRRPRSPRGAICLTLVAAAHAGSLALWLTAKPAPVTAAPIPPMMVELLAPTPLPIVAPAEPKPQPPQPVKQVARPRPAPPKPVARPNPEQAITEQAPPPAAPEPTPAPAEPAPVAEAPKPAPPAPAPPATVVAPKFDAAYLSNPAPPYPPMSRRMGEQGTVLVRVFVTAEGLPDKIELKKSSGAGRLDESALDVIKRWRFVPARRGDEKVGAWVVVPIKFSVEG